MNCLSTLKPNRRWRRLRAFTLMELLIAVAISSVVLAITATFIAMAARSTSGIVKQTELNSQAGRTSEFIFNRVRFATSISNDSSGDTLTLGFDDDLNVDSDNDKKAYNDKDHFEIFQLITNTATADYRLIYKSDATVARTNVLIKNSVAKLPGKLVFVVTNSATTVLLNYLLVDKYAPDGYQSCAIQTSFVARNRPDPASMISILP